MWLFSRTVDRVAIYTGDLTIRLYSLASHENRTAKLLNIETCDHTKLVNCSTSIGMRGLTMLSSYCPIRGRVRAHDACIICLSTDAAR
jgi:hypothetical protein